MARTDHGLPGIYNSSPITLATGEGAAPALDTNGQLIVSSTSSPSAPTSTTATETSVASSATSVALTTANTARKGVAVFNDSTAVLYLRLSATAATTALYTTQIGTGGYYEVPFGYTGAITGIWASANGAALITVMT